MSDVFDYDEKEKELPSLARESIKRLIDRKFTLCVPPQKGDDDAVISRVIDGFEKLQPKLKAQQELIDELSALVREAKSFVPTGYANYVSFKAKARLLLAKMEAR